MSEKTILVWFRNDLRVHDNEILAEAINRSAAVIPVYCFDPRYFAPTPAGTLKTGVVRAQFLIESVADLKSSLQRLGSDLLVARGKPEEVIPEIARKYRVDEVYHHREVSFEETQISENVETALWRQQINLKHFIGHTLYHKEDLPFPIRDIPDAFTAFRKKTERDSRVRAGFSAPESVPGPALEESAIPSLGDLGFTAAHTRQLAGKRFEGGETAGLLALETYFKNGSRGPSELSPWISLGCLSVRKVYWEARKTERQKGSPAGNAMILELLWRDYFRFMFKKHGNVFFNGAGVQDAPVQLPAADEALLEKWRAGATGEGDVDRAMNELAVTGWISDRDRQQTANYLVNGLNINWICGAAWFEEELIDYSPASNWGNWARIAGVGYESKGKLLRTKPA